MIYFTLFTQGKIWCGVEITLKIDVAQVAVMDRGRGFFRVPIPEPTFRNRERGTLGSL